LPQASSKEWSWAAADTTEPWSPLSVEAVSVELASDVADVSDVAELSSTVVEVVDGSTVVEVVVVGSAVVEVVSVAVGEGGAVSASATPTPPASTAATIQGAIFVFRIGQGSVDRAISMS
jgi:hypothetical protein